MYYELIISETSRNSLKDPSLFFNIIKESFKNLKELKEYLVERYGKIPTGKYKIYTDTKDGESKEVGFLHSYWNNDISHNSKNWYQTDWVEINEINKKTVLLKDIKKL